MVQASPNMVGGQCMGGLRDGQFVLSMLALDLQKYLEHFGYLKVPDPRLGMILSADEMAEGVKIFQRFAGLPQTGLFDLSTLKKMEEPRCGNPDIVGTEVAARKKRYALQGSNWTKKKLKYKLKSHTMDLPRHETEEAIDQAFKTWEKESGLTFERVRTTDRADIEIRFASGEHGDGDPFDGPSKTLAHAFFPKYGGDAHFDEDEKWISRPTGERGVNLTIVAAHEFGHSLGLSHSDNNKALMAPFYNPVFEGLHDDDIRGIQALYGAPNDRERPPIIPTRKPSSRFPLFPRKTTPSTPPEGACSGRFDAITMVRNGSTFAFYGDMFWRLNDKGMEKGYPQLISSGWGFSGSVDASLTYQGYTDFFQGKHVRRFINGRPVRGYPRLVSDVYPGMPSHIDTAYVWSGNGRIYFMKGGNYWRFNPSIWEADSGYPRPLSVWKGLPDSVDAALQWNDRTYFFKNGQYWRFDDERVEVAQSLKAPYPRASDEWWLGCSDNSLIEGSLGNDRRADGNGAGSRFQSGIQAQVLMSTILLTFFSRVLS